MPDAATPPIDAGVCTSLHGQACSDCCNKLWPVGAPELIFSNECYQCMSVCDGLMTRQHPPCGANTGPQPNDCFTCGKSKIAPDASHIGGCGSTCSEFVQCYSQCTAN
jgi:hypothetical protein